MRLIPAHAGKMHERSPELRVRGAHPRSRGENNTTEYATACQLGSSPLTRGKLEDNVLECLDERLIPAHAGKISATMPSRQRRRAHPRSRGENASEFLPIDVAGGSSPLTRGKLSRCAGSPSSQGLIPAHAGKITHPA